MDLLEDLQHLDLAAMFLLGLLGSGHCVGMCGPLVIAFPARRQHRFAHVLYNAGRIGTYTIIGALLAGLGSGVAALAGTSSLMWMARVQMALSAVAALFLLAFGLSKLGFFGNLDLLSIANPTRIPGFGRVQGRALAADGVGSIFVVGLVLGLLPCGLSYAAFARALAAEGPLEGAAMALSFGLGTVPALVAVGLGASRLGARHRRVSDLVAGVLMIGMAAALVAQVVF